MKTDSDTPQEAAGAGSSPSSCSAFDRVRNTDPVVNQMLRRRASMEEVVVYLAGEKAKLHECLVALHSIADSRNLNLRYDALVVEGLVATATTALKKIGHLGLGAAGAQSQACDRDTGIRQISSEVWRESPHEKCSKCGAEGFRTWELGVKLPNESNPRWDFSHEAVCDGCRDRISQNASVEQPGRERAPEHQTEI